MGYRCNFEIYPGDITDPVTTETICEQLVEITNGYEFVSHSPGVIYSGDAYKWFDHAKDLATLSELYPGTVFEMRVIGEDAEMWQVYAQDGATYENDIQPVWPEFDELRLFID